MLDAADRTGRLVSECSRSLRAVGQQTEDLRRILEQVSNRLETTHQAQLARRIPQRDNGCSDSDYCDGKLDEMLVSFVRASKTRTPLQPVELRDLFHHAAAQISSLSIGQFHDAVRRLNQQRRLRLLPYTQAMYQLAEPEFALVVGREVMYYVEPGQAATH